MQHISSGFAMRKHFGSTLPEVLIAVLILSLMLFSFMAIILQTSQDSIAAKEVQGAFITSISHLERLEATMISSDIIETSTSSLGSYQMDITAQRTNITPSVVEAELGVRTAWTGSRRMQDVTIGRRVSPSAWQNAGQVPNRP